MILLFITLSEMAITLAYFQLCAEDYRWWWPAFGNSGSVAVYVFAYAMYFFATESSMDSAASLAVYFGYTAIGAVTLWLMCASIGFTTTYIFLRKIFGSIKVD